MRILITLLLLASAYNVLSQPVQSWREYLNDHLKNNDGLSGVYVLEKGEDALIARAWLADNARHSIDVQYFIWSSDNIGTLAAASLLRAANRGVYVRVIVDDLLVDAENETLYALASHPNVEIKIYNPNINIGTSILGRMFNAAVKFRSINQRMHNKVYIVDNEVVITGGRNMADEYFDFDHEYNFRDRDVLMVGKGMAAANESFKEFWESEYAVSIDKLIDNPYEIDLADSVINDWGDEEAIDGDELRSQLKKMTDEKVKGVYAYLASYEKDEKNFRPEMRDKINDIDNQFINIIDQVRWVKADFISDRPGKNNNILFLDGGSRLTSELEKAVNSAKHSITIQSPYLVMSWDAWKLFRNAVKRGVKVRINTNSLSSTDNLAAYSGYARQRNRLLISGIEIYEFKPNAKIRTDIINRYEDIKHNPPVFAIHAKSMVVDSSRAFIGSFNFDPRSENLNTEVGVLIEDEKLAQKLESAIKIDMRPENSWNVKQHGHSHDASIFKRTKAKLLEFVPMDSIL